MEAVGVILGVLPLIIEAAKAYRTVAEKLKIFRHYSLEVGRVQRRFATQGRMFLNECALLLAPHITYRPQLCDVLDRSKRGTFSIVDVLGRNPEFLVSDEKLSHGVEDRLGESRQAFLDLIYDILDVIQDIRADLYWFAQQDARKQKGQKSRDAIHKLQRAATFAFDKYRYLRKLDTMRDRISDLSLLRNQVLGSTLRSSAEQYCERRDVPKSLEAIRVSAEALHDALKSTWDRACRDSSHMHHFAKLELNTAEIHDATRFRLEISYERGAKQRKGDNVALQIYSRRTNISDTSSEYSRVHIAGQTINDGAASAALHNNVRNDKSSKEAWAAISSGHNNRNGLEIRLRNRLGDGQERFTTDPIPVREQTPKDIEAQTEPKLILNICDVFQSSEEESFHEKISKYRGFVEYGSFRHFCQQSFHSDTQEGEIDLYQLIHDPSMRSVVHQLEVAHKLANTVLHYGSGPWLSLGWRLRELLFRSSKENTVTSALETMHICSKFSKGYPEPLVGLGFTNSLEDQPDAATALILGDLPEREKAQYGTTQDELQIRFGIPDLTLFSLGIALLELAYRKPLHELRHARDQGINLFTARRLAEEPISLGPKYQFIVQKCLQRGFAAGRKDLNDATLRGAVYSEVVVELEDMMKCLKI